MSTEQMTTLPGDLVSVVAGIDNPARPITPGAR